MSKLLEIFQNYSKSYNDILECFEIKGCYDDGPIYDCISERWINLDGGNSINYLSSSGEEYGYEYTEQCGKSVEGYVLFYVEDNGDKFFVLYSEIMEYKDIDEYEKQIDIEI